MAIQLWSVQTVTSLFMQARRASLPLYIDFHPNSISFPLYSELRKGLGIIRANGLVEVAALLREETMSVSQCITCVNPESYFSRDAA